MGKKIFISVLSAIALIFFLLFLQNLSKPSVSDSGQIPSGRSENDINESKTFRAVAAPFPPFTDPDSPGFGYVWEITKAALESQGYVVSLHFAPWARAMELAIDGQFDGLLPAYWTEERTQWFVFPSPVANSNIGFLKRLDREDIDFTGEFGALAGYTIGVGRGYSTSPEFDEADYLTKIEVATTPQILKMLWLERLDLAVGGFEYSLHFLQDLNDEQDYEGILDEIVFMKPELNTREIFLAISKKADDNEIKLADFNRGLEEIKRNGTFDAILAKAGFQVD